MALLTKTQLFCLVCNSDLDVNSCMNIFCASLPQNGGILVNFVLKVLKVSSSDLKSSYTCLRCYNLFRMLEQAQNTVANIQCKIFQIFQKSISNKILINESTDNNFTINQITENILETEKLECIENSSVIVIKNPSEINLKSLNNITNQINNEAVVSTDIGHNFDNEINVTNSNEKSKSINNNLNQQLDCNTIFNESFKAETMSLNKDNNVFFDKNNENNMSCYRNNSKSDRSINSSNLQDDLLPKPPSVLSKYSRKPLRHTCPTCNKKWRTTSELKSHMKSHSSLRPYMCEICGRAYKHKFALEIHVGIHNGISPFKCDHCDKCFTQRGALQRHLPMHTGEMPYQCTICNKRFKHHTSYNMHMLSHTKQKLYKCNVCDVSLLSTSHLKRHIRKHTGEKPYSCDSCGRSFAERYNLLAHRKIHNSVLVSTKEIAKNKYKCNECDKDFSKKQDYQNHVKQHTKESRSKDNWIEDSIKMKNFQNADINAANLLESCVTEVWQSLSKNVEK